MNNPIDSRDINDMVVGISREMRQRGGNRHADVNTLFFGGARSDDADLRSLADFGLRKNYNIIYSSFDTTNPVSRSMTVHAVVTDGVTQAVALQNGRLWKCDRKSAAVLLFPDTATLIRLNGRDQMILRQMSGPYHDQGYDMALDAVSKRTARKPGHVPVITPIGNLITVLDVRTLADTFAAAE